MNCRFVLAVVSTLFAVARPAHATPTAARQLDLMQYADAGALGDAVVAGRGLSASLMNPALLTGDTWQASATQAFWLDGIGAQALGLVGPSIHNVPLGLWYNTVSDTQERFNGSGIATGSFANRATDVTVAGSYAVPPGWLGGAAIGAALQYVSESYAGYSGQSAALRVGGLWGFRIGSAEHSGSDTWFAPLDLRLAASAGPLGPRLTVGTNTAPLPLALRLAASTEGFVKGLSTYGQIDLQAVAGYETIRLGASYGRNFAGFDLIARAGYVLNSAPGEATGLRVGLGVGYPVGRYAARLDYAFAPYGELGLTHRLTLSVAVRQGPVSEPPAPVPTPSLTPTLASTVAPTESPTSIPTPVPAAAGAPTGPLPTDFAATFEKGVVTLQWKRPEGVSVRGYNVYRSDAPGGEKKKLNSSVLKSPKYTDTVKTGAFYYEVAAVGINGKEGPHSSEIAGGEAPTPVPTTAPTVAPTNTPAPTQTPTVAAAAGPAPTNVEASYAKGVVTIRWQAPAGAAVRGYNVYRSDTAGGEKKKLNSFAVSATKYTNTVGKGATYYYDVTAVDRKGKEGAHSAEVSAGEAQQAAPAATGASPSAPTQAATPNPTAGGTPAALAPEGVEATAGKDGIAITWKAPKDVTPKGYNVYRGETAGGEKKKINSFPISATKYSNSSVKSGVTYYYDVTFLPKKGAESPHSAEVSAQAQ